MSEASPDMESLEPAEPGAEPRPEPERLEEATRTMRRPGLNIAPDRIFEIMGWVLVPIGIVLILLGWYGTAHTTRLWKQVPYVVSGGILGAAFVFAGGFFYFAYWLSKQLQEHREQARESQALAARTIGALERLELVMRQGFGVASADDVLLVTGSGTMAHRPSCPMLAGKNDVRPAVPGEEELRACPVCQPDVSALQPAGNGKTRARARRR